MMLMMIFILVRFHFFCCFHFLIGWYRFEYHNSGIRAATSLRFRNFRSKRVTRGRDVAALMLVALKCGCV